MYIGQFGNALQHLVCGWHLTANSNDFSGHAYNGVDTDVSYIAAGVIGGAGAKFNGSSSKININNAVNSTYISQSSYSVAVLIKLPISAPTTQPIFGRGLVQYSGKFYGTALLVLSNQVQFTRNIGTSSSYIITAPYTFESSKRYLIGLTVDRPAATAKIYVYPLESKSRSIGSGSFAAVNVNYSYSYDQGLNVGANLRGISNQYSTLTMNEFLVFDNILPASWFIEYAALLRGFR